MLRKAWKKQKLFKIKMKNKNQIIIYFVKDHMIKMRQKIMMLKNLQLKKKLKLMMSEHKL